jgi:NAD(P)-dependent dehydrogenase (short-subunit alcohol dehydrogenase family)
MRRSVLPYFDSFQDVSDEQWLVGHQELLAAIPQNFGIASNRITESEEVAALVTFLVSGRSANIIGSDYVIDGGTLKTM